MTIALGGHAQGATHGPPAAGTIDPNSGGVIGPPQNPKPPKPPPAGRHVGTTPIVPGAMVELRSSELTVVGLMGKQMPQLSGGVGGMEVITAPHQHAMTNWNGHPPWQLVVGIVFDGVSIGRSVETDIAALLDLATADHGDDRPPSLRVSGPLPYHPPVEGWIIQDLAWGDNDVVRFEQSRSRMRQDVVVTLIEDARARLVIRRKKTQKHHVHHKSYTAKHGDTLRTVAARFHVDGGWKALAKLNHIRDPKHLKAGKKLKLPKSSYAIE